MKNGQVDSIRPSRSFAALIPRTISYQLRSNARERLAWHRAHGYFEKLSHHNVSDLDTSAEAFAKKLDDVEAIVLALFRPKPAEDYEDLDAAIREGEEGAVTPGLIARITRSTASGRCGEVLLRTPLFAGVDPRTYGGRFA